MRTRCQHCGRFTLRPHPDDGRCRKRPEGEVSARTIDEILAMATRVGDCLVWPAHKLNQTGYGRYNGKLVHRIVYEASHGTIPPELVIDHICFNRACCDIAHLRLLTNSANAARQRKAFATHCKHGHPFDEVNTYRKTRGRKKNCRECRACNNAASKRYRDRKAAA